MEELYYSEAQYLCEAYKLKRSLHRMAMRFNGENYEDARVQVQDAITKGWENLRSFRYGNLYNWLCTIMKNQIMNEHGRHKKIKKYAGVMIEIDEAVELGYEPPIVYDFYKDEVAYEVKKAYSKLPLKYQEVFSLVRIEEYDPLEVSDILNIPSGTVKSRLFRAEQLLKNNLEKYGEKLGLEVKRRTIKSSKGRRSRFDKVIEEPEVING